MEGIIKAIGIIAIQVIMLGVPVLFAESIIYELPIGVSVILAIFTSMDAILLHWLITLAIKE